VPWAPHRVICVAKDASGDVIDDAYHLQLRLYRPSGELLTDKQRARAKAGWRQYVPRSSHSGAAAHANPHRSDENAEPRLLSLR
jgi:hypothetical protein